MTEPRVLRTPPYRKGRKTAETIAIFVVLAVFLFGCLVVGTARLDDVRPPQTSGAHR